MPQPAGLPSTGAVQPEPPAGQPDPQPQAWSPVQVQPSEQALPGVHVQSPSQVQESVQVHESPAHVQPSVQGLPAVQVQSPSQVQPSVQALPGVQVQSPPQVQPSVHSHGGAAVSPCANGPMPAAAGSANPRAASTIPAVRNLFTSSPLGSVRTLSRSPTIITLLVKISSRTRGSRTEPAFRPAGRSSGACAIGA